MKQATIKDIALNLNLSVSTVSRALSNHPDISDKTKELVKNTAKLLGYRLNIVARSLKSSQSKQIGVVVPEIKHDFFANAISGIEEIAYQKGYTVIITQSNENSEREKINLHSLFLNRVAGIIVSISQSTTSREPFRELLADGMKMVFFDRVFDDLEAYKVVVDDFDAAYRAVEYLAKKGYKKIIHLAGPENLSVCRNRKLGYEKAMSVFNLLPYSVDGGMHEQDGFESMSDLLNKGLLPEAVFAVNDPVAIGAFKKLKENNIKIPGQTAIIGFSNNPVTEVVEPSLTTIDQPAFQMGKAAAGLLFDQIESKEMKLENKLITLKTKLIIRQSA
ncbi:MAG: LacI family DNA-binding transcriptional regulator [Methanococcaceae archaeon]